MLVCTKKKNLLKNKSGSGNFPPGHYPLSLYISFNPKTYHNAMHNSKYLKNT